MKSFRTMLAAFLLCLAPIISGTTMVGGWTDADASSEKFRDLSNFALEQIDAQSNALYKQKVTEIVKAEQKVVSGVIYRITLRMSYTNCRKNSNAVNEECVENTDRSPSTCVVEIWEKVWESFRELQKFNCSVEQTRKRRSVSVSYLDEDEETLMKFKTFVTKFNKYYKDEAELKKRFAIFQENLLVIQALQENEQGTAEYGITNFTDLTKEEFRQKYLGLNPSLAKTQPPEQAKIPNVRIPTAFDWRDHGAVSPVKNQEQCGSCWAFSVTGNVEGQWAIQRKKLISLSEQELVDCDKLDQGCDGGYMTNGYEAIIKLGGIEGESDYPYKAEDEKCHFQKSDVRATLKSYVNISQDENEMAQWLFKNGPISIGINANTMQFYFGGVIHAGKFFCNPKDIDHGVLIVGYGITKSAILKKPLPYWIVKNSWGKSWGEKGYCRVYRGDGTCGINTMASSGVVG